MIRNYLLITFRSLLKNKIFVIINILGLVLQSPAVLLPTSITSMTPRGMRLTKCGDIVPCPVQ